MTKPMIRIHNVETDEVIDREMTDQEFAEYETHRLANEAKLAELAEKAQARQAILDRLGLTEDEAKILLG